MQTQPPKNRTLVGAGAILLALVIAGIALWSGGDKTPNVAGQEDTLPVVEDQVDGDLVAGEEATPVNAGTDELPKYSFEDRDLNGATGESDQTGLTDDAGDETEPTIAPDLGDVPEFHVVRPGETLAGISRNYYGTEAFYGDIESLNNLADPDNIYVGQELQLPRPEDLPGYGEQPAESE